MQKPVTLHAGDVFSHLPLPFLAQAYRMTMDSSTSNNQVAPNLRTAPPLQPLLVEYQGQAGFESCNRVTTKSSIGVRYFRDWDVPNDDTGH